MSKTEREIYPNNVLRLVAFEVRFPDVEELSRGVASFNNGIREVLPVPGPVPQEVTLEMQPGKAPATTHRDVGTRRLDRERRKSALITPGNLVVETTTYERYEVFRELVELAVRTLEESVTVPATTRIGLRYIDEIDAVELPQGANWGHFIEPHLLGPLYDVPVTPVETLTQARFAVKDDTQLISRFGLSVTPAVNRDGPLLIDGSEEGERFVIDVDSSWTPPDQTFPAYSTDLIMEKLDQLHEPIRQYFEESITDQLRDDVLRRAHDQKN